MGRWKFFERWFQVTRKYIVTLLAWALGLFALVSAVSAAPPAQARSPLTTISLVPVADR